MILSLNPVELKLPKLDLLAIDLSGSVIHEDLVKKIQSLDLKNFEYFCLFDTKVISFGAMNQFNLTLLNQGGGGTDFSSTVEMMNNNGLTSVLILSDAYFPHVNFSPSVKYFWLLDELNNFHLSLPGEKYVFINP